MKEELEEGAEVIISCHPSSAAKLHDKCCINARRPRL